MTTSNPFRIVFALYPGMTHLDFTGPQQLLSRMPASETLVCSRDGGTIASDGLHFANLRRLDEVAHCDLICVPGGPGATAAGVDIEFIAQVRRLASTAKYVTSVCTGSLILGAAGLLKGRRATSHWASLGLLQEFGAIARTERVVRDGNVITGGGVTAGIDFALTVIAEVAGLPTAQAIQLAMEYAPAPPFNAGSPDTAPSAVVERYRSWIATHAPARKAEVALAVQRLAG